MLTKAFWVDALERAVRAGAWCLLSLLVHGAATAGGDLSQIQINLLTLPWLTYLGIALGSMAASLLASLAGSQVGAKGTASLLPASAADVPADVPHGKHEK